MNLPPDVEAKILATPGVRIRSSQPRPGANARPKAALVPPGFALEFLVQYRAANESNQRDWRARSRRTKDARAAWLEALVRAGMLTWLPPAPMPPLTVTLTRLGGRKMDDDGNVSSLKGLRDHAARWLGLDDGDDRLTWRYGWEPGPLCGVRVRIESVGGKP